MDWLILIMAGLFEVGFAFCLGKAKAAVENEYWYWIIGFLISLTVSMLLLYKATLTIPIGTAYAIWTGVGAVGSVIIGIIFFRESTEFWRLFFLFTLICSIIGLKYTNS